MTEKYPENGYVVIKRLFNNDELQELREILFKFHESWKLDNADFYAEKAVNSSYITDNKYLREPERIHLFKFIGSSKLMDIVTSTMNNRPTFMNTQLFFNPANTNKKTIGIVIHNTTCLLQSKKRYYNPAPRLFIIGSLWLMNPA